ncbi:(Fe-S)-binding protein [Desertibaculum subflavum]|uniref:(Fe-S)-binding protein n=1 Tax=Desertibaculum subflavum TaxID=2268458 RepID=UPI000E66D381
MSTSLKEYFAAEAEAIAGRCTACGACHAACPVAPFADPGGASSAELAGSVRCYLADATPLSAAAARWTESCNGCGDCIPACPEAVNPRQMLILALTQGARAKSETPQLFRRMSRAIKMMLAMQLEPEELRRLAAPRAARQAPVVFYTGCNALRTPHLLFNTMAVLDALAVDYEVVGGPSACCGVIHTKWQGEIETGGRVARNTLARFADFTPEKVLNWCPTCQLHLTESLANFHASSFDMNHVTEFLVARLEGLAGKFVRPIPRRVVLHAHTGYRNVGEAVARLLQAIPGLDLVETVYESGYTCGGSGCGRAPALQAKEHGHLLDRVAATGADALVTLYHGCHGAFAASEAGGRHQVLNFTDLLVEALGLEPYEDRNKHLRLAADLDMMIAEAQPYLRANGLDLSDAWLRQWLPEIMAQKEFKGGLDCFAAHPHVSAGEPA